jgi:hypothetical protein
MSDGPVAGKYKKGDLPELMCEIVPASAKTIEAKWFKLAKAGGWKAKDGVATAKGIILDGVPDCTTLSGKSKSIGCNGKAEIIKVRGVKGVFSIGFSGANGPLIGTFASASGAIESITEATGETPYAVTGTDTGIPQSAGMYVATFDGVVYQVVEFNATSGGTVTQRPKNDLSGIDHSAITGMEPRVTLKMIKLDSGNNVYASAETNGSETFTLIGSTPFGGAYDITVSGLQVLDLTNDDADGFETFSFDGVVKSVEVMAK